MQAVPEAGVECWGSFLTIGCPTALLHFHFSVTLHLLSIFLFWTLPMKGITQRVAFCDWLLNRAFPTFPRSIRVVCVSGLHSFTWPGNIPFYKYSTVCWPVHLLMEIWVVCSSWRVWILPLWAFVNEFLCGCVFSFLLGVCPGVGLLLSQCRNFVWSF